ncbi:hypothetical protein [Desulforhopalus sp. IMCC35007]|uniref:hypothetical protein n=1 Tax=Desulforhopalus sp. IMCC35007 TaxID=2569543 RepID=UPI0010ADD178|nr:hypothetical protein [Desulforhopalus sp. IMCC35007]TKB10032.1 hypothetical protein FCL48_08680 [Desulforhopalus sp. IMCC35007]
MKLIQAKLRGSGPVIRSSWFQLSAHINQFYFSESRTGTAFLRAIQTLHPPFSCKKKVPFALLPHFEQIGSHTRHIQPEKRTVVFGVFAATPDVVTELGKLDHNLYETDRIEIGRRMDNSRWLNFVELSSSTRWKEIDENMRVLMRPLKTAFPEKYQKSLAFMDSLKESDRVRGELADRLLLLLQSLGPEHQNNIEFQETTALIERAAHFQAAREIVYQKLPLMIYFNEYGEIAPPLTTKVDTTIVPSKTDHNEFWDYIKQYRPESSLLQQTVSTGNQSSLDRLRNGIHLATTVSKEFAMPTPIFLFDAPERHLNSDEQSALKTLIIQTAKSHQCIYRADSKSFFNSDAYDRSYSDSELEQSNIRDNDGDRRNQAEEV